MKDTQIWTTFVPNTHLWVYRAVKRSLLRSLFIAVCVAHFGRLSKLRTATDETLGSRASASGRLQALANLPVALLYSRAHDARYFWREEKKSEPLLFFLFFFLFLFLLSLCQQRALAARTES